jgi:hypothetical protein
MKAVLGPMIEERLEKDARYGKNWEGKPVRIVFDFDTARAYDALRTIISLGS